MPSAAQTHSESQVEFPAKHTFVRRARTGRAKGAPETFTDFVEEVTGQEGMPEIGKSMVIVVPSPGALSMFNAPP